MSVRQDLFSIVVRLILTRTSMHSLSIINNMYLFRGTESLEPIQADFGRDRYSYTYLSQGSINIFLNVIETRKVSHMASHSYF